MPRREKFTSPIHVVRSLETEMQMIRFILVCEVVRVGRGPRRDQMHTVLRDLSHEKLRQIAIRVTRHTSTIQKKERCHDVGLLFAIDLPL